MERYDYLECVKEDVRNYISEHEIVVNEDNRDEVEQDLNDRLWVEDSVTGNASGSYTFNTWQAEENLCHNLDLLGEAFSEFCVEGSALKEAMESAEGCDVAIRCYLLGQAIAEVLNEILEEDEK